MSVSLMWLKRKPGVSGPYQDMSALMFGFRGTGAGRQNARLGDLGADEIDLRFNVKVTTRANGVILDGSGGNATALRAELSPAREQRVGRRFGMVRFVLACAVQERIGPNTVSDSSTS